MGVTKVPFSNWSEQCRADDAGVVVERRGDDARVELNLGEELVRLLGHTATDDEQVGPEEALQLHDARSA